MTLNDFIYEVKRIMACKLSEAETDFIGDCFAAGWSVDRVVQILNTERNLGLP